jgi:hypothetical protein
MVDNKMTMTGLGEMALGILTLIVIVSIVPLVGNSIDSATSIPAGSDWNATENTDIPTGAGMWGTLGPFIQLAAIILIVAGFLTTLRGLKGGNN